MNHTCDTCDDCGAVGDTREVPACADGHASGNCCCVRHVCADGCYAECDGCGKQLDTTTTWNGVGRSGWKPDLECADCGTITAARRHTWNGLQPWVACARYCDLNCFALTPDGQLPPVRVQTVDGA